MNKKLITMILSFSLLTGCSNSPNVLLTYSNTDITTDALIGRDVISDVADFFADDLTIIPDSLNHMEDSKISATSSLIVNNNKNEVLFANNIYERLFPASLTKIVTALVVLNHADLTDTVTVSKNAASITESGAKLIGLREGDKISLDDLLQAFLIYSGNDAGIAIAEHVAGTEVNFAKMMNEEAKKVGAIHSNFVNSHGLHDDNHYTTVYDLYLIFNQLVQFDKFVSIINESSCTIHYTDSKNRSVTREFLTTNRYLRGTETAPEDITVLGGKTGTTSKAGNCLILYSKDNNNNSYISVVMQAENGNSLFSQMTRLLEMIP